MTRAFGFLAFAGVMLFCAWIMIVDHTRPAPHPVSLLKENVR